MTIKLMLRDRNPAIVTAWNGLGLDGECASIFDHPADAIVSPANSFGFMDGGIDLAYSERFGWGVEDRLQELIRSLHDDELLVGRAATVGTGDADFPWLIAAPTMRVPMVIPDPTSVRLATRAAVRAALSMGLKSIAIPGMGAGTGQVKPEWVACMMKAGIEDALSPRPFPRSINVASSHHYAVKP